MKKFISLLYLFLFAAVACAQSTETKQPALAKTTATKSVERDPAAKERRARARALLVSLSTDARTFRDQTLRARSLARIADALWQVDPEQSRLLFHKAWEAAETGDQESDPRDFGKRSQRAARRAGSNSCERKRIRSDRADQAA